MLDTFIGKGVFVTWELFRDKKLTISEKFILIEISNLSALKLGCVANNNHFSELMGIKKEAVSRLIQGLVKKGYIESKINSGSRNFGRVLTLNKMLFNPKQNVIAPLTKCLETKENKTINKTINKYDLFIQQLKEQVSIPSKVTKTIEGKKLFKGIDDVDALINSYVKHQLEKKEFSQRITAYMEDYNTHEIKGDAKWII